MATLVLSLNCPFHKHPFYLLWFWSISEWSLLLVSHRRNPFSLYIRVSIQRWSCPEYDALGVDHGRDCPNRMNSDGAAIWVWHRGCQASDSFYGPCSAWLAPKSTSAEFSIRAIWTSLWICCLSSQDFLYCLNVKARALFCVCVFWVSFLDTDAPGVRTRGRWCQGCRGSVPTAGFGTRLLSPWSCCSPSSADGHLLPSLLPCGRCCPPCLTSLFHKNDLLCHILQLFQPFVWEITFPFPSPTKLRLKPRG